MKMTLNKSNICKGVYVYFFVLVALEPAAVQHSDYISSLFDFAQFIMFIVILYFRLGMRLYRIKLGRLRNIPIDVRLGIYYLILSAVTLIHAGSFRNVILQGIQFVGFAMYLEIMCEENPEELFCSVLNVLMIYVLINLFLIIVIPSGLYSTAYYDNNFLLGYDNQNINFMLPAMVLVLLKNLYYKKCKWQIVCIYGACLATSILIWSAATLIVVCTMSIFAFFCLRKKGFLLNEVLDGSFFNLTNGIMFNIILCIGLIFFQIQYYFEFLIDVVLKRSMTLTNRSIIWQRTIPLIKRKWIWGYGKEAYADRALKLGFKEKSTAGLHAHNRFMETWYRGGIVLEVVYIAMLFHVAKCLKPFKNTALAKILAFSIFIYMVGMLSEFYDYCIFFWGFMVIAENCQSFIREGARQCGQN